MRILFLIIQGCFTFIFGDMKGFFKIDFVPVSIINIIVGKFKTKNNGNNFSKFQPDEVSCNSDWV